MKTMSFLRKTTLLLILVFSLNTLHAKDTPISVDQLPVAASNFLKTYYPTAKVSHAILDESFFHTDYEVLLDNRAELEFDEKGNWKDIDGKKQPIPTGFIPSPILKYVKDKFPSAVILKIEKDASKYELELNDDIDLEFDLSGNFLRIN